MGIRNVEVQVVAVGINRRFEGQPVGVAQTAAVERLGVATEEELFRAADGAVGWEQGLEPAFDGERVGERELRRVGQFDLSIEEEPRRADISPAGVAEIGRRGVGGAIEESAVVAADEVLGALAERVHAAVPPADGAGAAEVVVQFIAVAGDGGQQALNGAGGHRQPIGRGHVEEGIADHGDRSIEDGPVPEPVGGVVRAAQNGGARLVKAAGGRAEVVREDEHRREVGGVGNRRVVRIEPADDDRRRVGGSGEEDGVGFPARPVGDPGDAIGEGEYLNANGGVGQGDFRDHGADEDVGAVLAAAAGVIDGIDLARREGALIGAELVQAARERGSRNRAAKGPIQDVLVCIVSPTICAKSNPTIAISVGADRQPWHQDICKHLETIKRNVEGRAIERGSDRMDCSILEIDIKGRTRQVPLRNISVIRHDCDGIATYIAVRRRTPGVEEDTDVVRPIAITTIQGCRSRRVILHGEDDFIPADTRWPSHTP